MLFNFRLFIRLLSGFVLISLLIGVITWLLLRGSLPQYKGDTTLPGLETAVRIERDSLGTATFHAQNRLDLTRALGYVHAQERFFEMDLTRRRAAGELAELFGASALSFDRKIRPYRLRARVSAMLKQLPEDQRELLNAYREGINNGLNALTIRPFPYLLTGNKPQQWHSEDSLLVVMAMFLTLNESSITRELKLSTMQATLPDSVYQFLTAGGGEWDAPLIGPAMTWPELPSASELNLQTLDPNLLPHNYEPSRTMPGSNSFAVAGSLANGSALIANDMHLELRVPNIWFRTRLIYPDPLQSDEFINITGITLPGTPTIIIGSNRHIAWSFTNSYGDFADWVEIKLDPQDPMRYQGTSGWKSVSRFHETLKIKDAPNETIIISETEWGPIVATNHNGMPLALQWTALQPTAINFDLTMLEQVKTAKAAIKIAQNSGVPAQNFIVGDRQGNIIWTIAGKLPQRSKNYNPKLPANWQPENTGWQGWLSVENYPVISNPQSERLWSANARMIAGNELQKLGDGGYGLGARAKQIRDNLYQQNKFTPTDMLAIQLDHRALFLTPWYKLLNKNLEQTKNSPWVSEIKNALQDWNGKASTDSTSYVIVQAYRNEVIKNILAGFAAAIRRSHPNFELPRLSQIEHAIWLLIEQRPQHLLSPNYENWDDLLLDSAKQVINKKNQNTKSNTNISWGEHNKAQITHPLSHILPGVISNWLDMPNDAMPGDVNMPHVQTPDFGASMRMSVSPGNEEEGYFDMPGGQSGHPLSSYYGSGHNNWVSQKPTPFLPGQPENILWINPM